MTIENLNEKRELLYNIIKSLQEKPDTKETRALLYSITVDLETLFKKENFLIN